MTELEKRDARIRNLLRLLARERSDKRKLTAWWAASYRRLLDRGQLSVLVTHYLTSFRAMTRRAMGMLFQQRNQAHEREHDATET